MEYFFSIFLEMSYVTIYLANSRVVLIPLPGSWDLSSVVYGGLTTHITQHRNVHCTAYAAATES